MKRGWRTPALIPALNLVWLLCSCSAPTVSAVKAGAYRVATKELKNDPSAVSRQYSIETSSQQMLNLTRVGGKDSVSMAPDTMAKESTAKTEVTVTISMQGSGADKQVVLEGTVNSRNGTAKLKRELSVPADAELKSILTETKVAGEMTSKTTLLRVASGDQYLELGIE